MSKTGRLERRSYRMGEFEGRLFFAFSSHIILWLHPEVADPWLKSTTLSALRIEREPLNTGGGGWVKWVVLLVLLGAAGGGAWYWLNRERPVEVEVATVTERAAGTQASVLNASGYVTARRRATVSSKVTGKVIEVNVEEGMAVREGQVLARLDDSTLQAGAAAVSRAARSGEAADSRKRSAARTGARAAAAPGAAAQGRPEHARTTSTTRRPKSIRSSRASPRRRKRSRSPKARSRCSRRRSTTR